MPRAAPIFPLMVVPREAKVHLCLPDADAPMDRQGYGVRRCIGGPIGLQTGCTQKVVVYCPRCMIIVLRCMLMTVPGVCIEALIGSGSGLRLRGQGASLDACPPFVAFAFHALQVWVVSP